MVGVAVPEPTGGFGEFAEQLGLTSDRGVHATAGHPGPFGDLGDGGCGVTVLDEQLTGRGEQQAGALLAVRRVVIDPRERRWRR